MKDKFKETKIKMMQKLKKMNLSTSEDSGDRRSDSLLAFVPHEEFEMVSAEEFFAED